LVRAAKPGNEVVFKSSNGSFGGVAAVYMWGHKLEFDVFAVHVLLERFGCFVVELLEAWAQASRAEWRMHSLVSCQVFRSRFVFHGLAVDVVTVEIVDDEQVGVALAGGREETAGGGGRLAAGSVAR
jgi:hypothetical protein